MGIVNVNLPATDAWKELMKQRRSHNLKGLLGNDGENMNIEDVKLLYKLSEDGEYATLYDVYEEGMEIERGIVVPLSSTYMGKYDVSKDTKIVNVDGSSEDTVGNTDCHYGWIAIYRFITENDTNRCCTDGYTYKVRNNYVLPNNLQKCNANPIDIHNMNCRVLGGHVIVGHIQNGEIIAKVNYNEAEIPAANDIVAIMPICYAHNNYRHNDSYMIVRETTPAVVLNYTLGRNAFQNYIK